MSGINVPLVLIGKKEHKSFDLDAISKSYGVESKIITLGFVPEEDLISILSSSKVFCFPSNVEGFGLPPLEAMKCGVPVVTTKGTSIPEVCGDAVLYFEPDNSVQLAGLVNSLIYDDKLGKIMIDKGLIQASSFTWESSALRLIKILEKI
jgi:glycosyltransferase involved in cell wall biosynthesis